MREIKGAGPTHHDTFGRVFAQLDSRAFHESFLTWVKAVSLQTKESDCHSYETADKGHGRIEIRRYRISGKIDWFADKKQWKGLQSIGMVESERTVGEQTTIERRYYLTSLKADAGKLARAVRRYWSIENLLHWSLDVGPAPGFAFGSFTT